MTRQMTDAIVALGTNMVQTVLTVYLQMPVTPSRTLMVSPVQGGRVQAISTALKELNKAGIEVRTWNAGMQLLDSTVS